MAGDSRFTEVQLARMYEMTSEYGGENKPKFLLELKSLILADREKLKSSMFKAIKNLDRYEFDS